MIIRPDSYEVLALDYDGTLADEGVVSPDVLDGLTRFKASGRRLVMVTGRELDDLTGIFPEADIFDRIVAENGAVWYTPGDGELRTAASAPDRRFIERLRRDGVSPLSVGKVVVATEKSQAQSVVTAYRDLGLDLDVILNRVSLMVLPKGVNKTSGFLGALGELNVRAENVIGMGDAENDCDWLDGCGCGVAVRNAIPELLETADVITWSPAGRGVLEMIEELLA
jgi:hydroxymethylpyrimidine pyrophosphatase-like HAD family hydrolase